MTLVLGLAVWFVYDQLSAAITHLWCTLPLK